MFGVRMVELNRTPWSSLGIRIGMGMVRLLRIYEVHKASSGGSHLLVLHFILEESSYLLVLAQFLGSHPGYLDNWGSRSWIWWAVRPFLFPHSLPFHYSGNQSIRPPYPSLRGELLGFGPWESSVPGLKVREAIHLDWSHWLALMHCWYETFVLGELLHRLYCYHRALNNTRRVLQPSLLLSMWD